MVYEKINLVESSVNYKKKKYECNNKRTRRMNSQVGKATETQLCIIKKNFRRLLFKKLTTSLREQYWVGTSHEFFRYRFSETIILLKV